MNKLLLILLLGSAIGIHAHYDEHLEYGETKRVALIALGRQIIEQQQRIRILITEFNTLYSCGTSHDPYQLSNLLEADGDVVEILANLGPALRLDSKTLQAKLSENSTLQILMVILKNEIEWLQVLRLRLIRSQIEINKETQNPFPQTKK